MQNLTFVDTTINGDRGRGMIIAPRMAMELAHIMRRLLELKQSRTPLQQAMRDLAKLLTVTVVIFNILIPFLGRILERRF